MTLCDNIVIQSQTERRYKEMSEKEKKVVEKLKKAIPQMSDFDKGYILGKVENMTETEKKNKKCSE